MRAGYDRRLPFVHIPMTSPMSPVDAPADARPGDLAAELAPALAELARGLGERAGCMLAVKDATDGRYRYVNDAMAEFLGRPAAAIVGSSDPELIDPAIATLLRTACATSTRC